MVVNTHSLGVLTVSVAQEQPLENQLLFFWQIEASRGSKSPEWEHIFDIVLTRRDIGQQIYIPDEHTDKLFLPVVDSMIFPLFLPDSLTGLPVDADFLYIDSVGKTWWLSFSGHHRCFSGGWGQFVREKDLVIGDKVSFWRVRIIDKYGKNIHALFVDYEKSSGPDRHAHQRLFMPNKWIFDSHSSLTSISSKIHHQLTPTSLEDPSSSVGKIEKALGDVGLRGREQAMFDKMLSPGHVGKIEKDQDTLDKCVLDSHSLLTPSSSISSICHPLKLVKLENQSVLVGKIEKDPGGSCIVQGRGRELTFDKVPIPYDVEKVKKDPNIMEKCVWGSSESVSSLTSTSGIHHQLRLEDPSVSAGNVEDTSDMGVLQGRDTIVNIWDTKLSLGCAWKIEKDPWVTDKCVWDSHSSQTSSFSISGIDYRPTRSKDLSVRLEDPSVSVGNVEGTGDMGVLQRMERELMVDTILTLGCVGKIEEDPAIPDKCILNSHSSLTSSSSIVEIHHKLKPTKLEGSSILVGNIEARGDAGVLLGREKLLMFDKVLTASDVGEIKNKAGNSDQCIWDSYSSLTSLTSESGIDHQLNHSRLEDPSMSMGNIKKDLSDSGVVQGRGTELMFDKVLTPDNVRKVEKDPSIPDKYALDSRSTLTSSPSITGTRHQLKAAKLEDSSMVSRNIEKNPDLGVEMLSTMELMFNKVLTPSDVGKLNRLVIPKLHAEKYFPLSSLDKRRDLVFSQNGKPWRFRFSYWSSSQSYVLTKGWSRFVKKNQLASGDVVSFLHGVGKKGKYKLFINCRYGPRHAITFSPHVTASSPLDFCLQTIGADALLCCTLFPPDYEFERDALILLWLAEGFFPEESSADIFFENCRSREYFQFVRNDLVTEKDIYKFTGQIDLDALLESKGSHFVRMEGLTNLNDFSPDVSHVSLKYQTGIDSAALVGFKRFKQLRTLIFLKSQESGFKQVPRDFFLSLKHLRVLDLSRTCIRELPSSVGNMKSLCYLDLSENPITRLPEAIDCVYNLQTLRLRGCSSLSSLPKGTKKLVNLRHLDLNVIHQLRSMPQGMGALTGIRTLSGFLVGLEDECGIQQLKNMNYLKGSFCISRLENVLTEEEATEACLGHKSQLKKLELHWNDSCDEDVVDCGMVLSSLQPNTNLEELQIVSYGGFELPGWVSDPSFSSLASLTLFKCKNCLVLPSLGQLPSLKFLSIVGFHKLKVIDNEFYGPVGIQGYNVFPKLEKLTIEDIYCLEEWKGIKESTFPCLCELKLNNCPKLCSLGALSFLSSLEVLELYHCPMLSTCPEDDLPIRLHTFIIEDCALISAFFSKNGTQDLLKVAHVQNVWIDHKEIAWLRIS